MGHHPVIIELSIGESTNSLCNKLIKVNKPFGTLVLQVVFPVYPADSRQYSGSEKALAVLALDFDTAK